MRSPHSLITEIILVDDASERGTVLSSCHAVCVIIVVLPTVFASQICCHFLLFYRFLWLLSAKVACFCQLFYFRKDESC